MTRSFCVDLKPVDTVQINEVSLIQLVFSVSDAPKRKEGLASVCPKLCPNTAMFIIADGTFRIPMELISEPSNEKIFEYDPVTWPNVTINLDVREPPIIALHANDVSEIQFDAAVEV